MAYQHLSTMPRAAYPPVRIPESPTFDKKLYPQLSEHLRTNYAVDTDSLTYSTPFELLMAAILLPQSDIAEVNLATDELFESYRSARAIVFANRRDLEKIIRKVGFYRQKAKYMQLTSQMLLTHHEGEVPDEMVSLTRLPGVARKTANFIMAELYNVAAGVIVDTRVSRVARRLGLAQGKSAEAIENQLMRLLPREDWLDIPQLMIAHADAVCDLNLPDCAVCPLKNMCPSANIEY